MYAALIRAAEGWRRIGMMEFEQLRLNAIRSQRDQARNERTASATSPNAAASPARLSSRPRI